MNLAITLTKRRIITRFKHRKKVVGGSIRDKHARTVGIVKQEIPQMRKIANPQERKYLKLRL
jgi:hypothetical protein